MSEGELWVQPSSGTVYRLAEQDWTALGGGQAVLYSLDGRERQAPTKRLAPYALSAVHGAQAVLDDERVQAALLGAFANALPTDARWLTEVAGAQTAEQFMSALEQGGPGADEGLDRIRHVLDALNAQGGPGRLAEIASEAARQVPATWAKTDRPAAPALRLLASVLHRASLEDPTWRPTYGGSGPPERPEAIYERSRAQVAAKLNLSPPDFSYADLLGREPGEKDGE